MARNPSPKYCRQRKPNGRHVAFVELNGRRNYLGLHGTPESKAAYHRLVAEWQAAGRRLPVPAADITVVEVCNAFRRHAEGYYAKDGKPTSEVSAYLQAIAPLTGLYGRTPAADFGPIQLKAVRANMLKRGWCRTNIN